MLTPLLINKDGSTDELGYACLENIVADLATARRTKPIDFDELCCASIQIPLGSIYDAQDKAIQIWKARIATKTTH